MNMREQDHFVSDKDIREQTKRGIFWTTLFNAIQFGIRFGGSIVLARILFPEDFGLMAIINLVLQFARRLTSFGFTMVLVQRKDISNEHYETVFVVNLVLMGMLSLMLFFGAFWIGNFFNNTLIEYIIKVIGLIFIFEALTGVPISILRRHLRFKELETSNTIQDFIATVSPIGFALADFGVWSLVFGFMLGKIVHCLVIFYYTRWTPRFRFYFWALKDVFSFGLWTYLSTYVTYAISQVDYFIVGKLLDVTQLGFYERAFNLMRIPKKQIGLQINSIIFSAYSRVQDDKDQVVKILLQVVSYFSLITYPLMAWVFFSAPFLIRILYGPKWISSIRPLQIMCIAGIIDTLTGILDAVVMALGLVGNKTRRNFIFLILLTLSILVGVHLGGINGAAWGTTVSFMVQLGLMLHLAIYHLPLSIGQFIKTQRSSIIYTLIQIASLLIFQYTAQYYAITNDWIMLISISILSLTVLILSHLMIRFKDIDSIFLGLFNDLKKFAWRIPILNRMSFLKSNAPL